MSEFESQFAKLTGYPHAVAFRYGRSGLFYLLKALGIKGKKVVLPAYTCIVVSNAVVMSGNVPVFLDSLPDSLQPDPDAYIKAIDSETGMIIPTHLFGISEDFSSLYSLVKQKYPNVFVLQDCAHSFFCADSTGKVATINADGALFGLGISKLVNSVKGGMLCLRDPNLVGEIRKTQAIEKKKDIHPIVRSMIARLYVGATTCAFTPLGYELVRVIDKKTSIFDSESMSYDPEKISLPRDFMLPLLPFHAEIGIRSLEKFDERVKNRKVVVDFYYGCFRNFKSHGFWMPKNFHGNTWSHLPVLVPADNRDTIRSKIEKSFGLEVGVVVDYSIPDIPAYKRWKTKRCNRASEVVTRILNLPINFLEGLFPIRDWKPKVRGVCEIIKSELS